MQRAHTPTAEVTDRQLAIVLIGCGLVGALLGAIGHPTWHDALEPAQVLAGLVQYPPANVVYLSEVRTWTVLHQVGAALLLSGLDERTLAIVLSGLLGAVSLQAIGLLVLALTSDTLLAISCPVFVYLTNATAGGITYPVALMGTNATYGVLGLSLMLLTLALFALDRPRLAAFLLGLAPAVHPTIGIWCLAIVAASLLWDRPTARQWIAQAWPAFLGGLALTCASAYLQHVLTVGEWPPTQAPHELTPSILRFVRFWDSHRRPFAPVTGAMSIVLLTTSLCVVSLTVLNDHFAARCRFLLRALIVAIAVGGLLSISYWFEGAPMTLLQLMPSRLLNLGSLTCMALIVSIAWTRQDDLVAQVLMAVIVVGLCLRPDPGGLDRANVPGLMMRVIGTALVLSTLAGRGLLAIDRPIRRRLVRGLRLATTIVPFLALVAIPLAAARTARPPAISLVDASNDPALAAAAHRTGLLLTGGQLRLIQLRTRRPVLLDAGYLDMLNYMPDLAIETEEILRKVYSVDLLHAPAEVWRHGTHRQLLESIGKAAWAGRSPSEWKEIATAFGVYDVLTSSDWVLQLSVVARSGRFTLYEILAPEHGEFR